MAAVLVVLVFVDTFLTGLLLRVTRELRDEHERLRDYVNHQACPDGPLAAEDGR